MVALGTGTFPVTSLSYACTAITSTFVLAAAVTLGHLDSILESSLA